MKYAVLVLLLLLPACDKAAHLGAGFIISGGTTEVTGDRSMGCAASIVAGVAKEAFGVFDPLDIIATVVGGCLPIVPQNSGK